jgi:hypothetical protein
MADFVISAPDAATFVAAAAAMGFSDGQGGIIAQGRIPGDSDPLASYFFNFVGAIPDASGVWSRLRINGDNPFTRGLIVIPASLIVYSLVTSPDGSAAFWAADGTPAPEFVANVGVIA